MSNDGDKARGHKGKNEKEKRLIPRPLEQFVEPGLFLFSSVSTVVVAVASCEKSSLSQFRHAAIFTTVLNGAHDHCIGNISSVADKYRHRPTCRAIR